MSPLATVFLIVAIAAAIALGLALLQWRLERMRHRAASTALIEAHRAELEQSRQERELLLNALNDAFLLVDPSAQILFANRAAHRLCHARSLTGRPIREAFIDPRLASALGHCLDSSGPVQTQVTLPDQSSPARNLEARSMNTWIIDAAKLPGPDGHAALTRIIIRDITSEFQADQIRKDFVANASHELRTPMAIISGYLENLLDDDLLGDPESARRFLGVMRKHADRMSRIIEDMLMISKLESAEHQPLRKEDFDLRDCFQDILERLESVIRSQQAEIRLALPEDPPITLHGDRFYWMQALFNLVENALKQNPQPGLKLELGAADRGEHHEVWISDNGVGIPGADLPFIFRRFYRVDKQHSQSAIKGTGLGLSIVKRAIEAHGGTITAHSTPGTETKFLITLPKPLKDADESGKPDPLAANDGP